MHFDSKGFVQIPILIAILVSAVVFGGGGYYFAHRATVSSQVAATPEVATATDEMSAATTETLAQDVISDTAEQKQATLKKESVAAVQIDVPNTKIEVATPIAKDFKQPVLNSITAQVDSYKAITAWIDSDMMPLLSQRESMLNGLISSTNSLMATETDSSVDYAYSIFIQAYNLDKTQIVDFYRGIFSDVKNHINSEKISALNADYAKFSAKPSVSEAEYNAEIQVLAQYQANWQSLYNDGVKAATTQFMTQTNKKDAWYQSKWAELSAAVADLKKTQTLQSNLNQLYAQQVRPLNCTFSSHFNGIGTVGSLNCY